MTELELIVKNLDKIGTELYNKFGTESYDIRCELHDIKDQLEAINYTRCCTELKSKEAPTFDEWLKKWKWKQIGSSYTFKRGESYTDAESLLISYKKEHYNL